MLAVGRLVSWTAGAENAVEKLLRGGWIAGAVAMLVCSRLTGLVWVFFHSSRVFMNRSQMG